MPSIPMADCIHLGPLVKRRPDAAVCGLSRGAGDCGLQHNRGIGAAIGPPAGAGAELGRHRAAQAQGAGQRLRLPHAHLRRARAFPPPRPAARACRRTPRVAEYRLLQKRIGTTRTVDRAAARPTRTDNRVTLDAIAQLGRTRAASRWCIPTVTDAELKTLARRRHPRHPLHPVRSEHRGHHDRHDRAAREARAPISAGTCRSTCAATRSSTNADMLRRLPAPIVFDHMGAPAAAGRHRAMRRFKVMRALIDKGRTWVKLSGAYQDTKIGPPTYADATGRAGLSSRPRPSAWCGAATGRIRRETRQAERRAAVRSAVRMGAGRARRASASCVENPAGAVRLCEIELTRDVGGRDRCRPANPTRHLEVATRLRLAICAGLDLTLCGPALPV